MNLTNKNALSTMTKGFSLTALAAAVAISTGCSNADDPDSGTNVAKSPVQGAVVDAYLAGATVYIDGNNNGKRDAWESSAMTDGDGFFSTNADGTIDYCASDATEAQARHCLTSAATGTGTLRAYGGFDIFTGEPFVGSMAASVNLNVGNVANQVISPLTSVLAEAGEDASQVLAQLDISPDQANSDFLGAGAEASFDAALTNQALKLHKVVQLFEDVFSEQFDAFGLESNFPQRPSVLIYAEIAEQLANGNSLNSTSLNTVFASVNDTVRALYDDLEDGNFPGDASSTTVIADAVQILGLIDSAIPNNTTGLDEARLRMVGVEAVVNKMNSDASDLNDAVNQVSNLASELYTTLGGANDFDFSALVDFDFSTTTDFSGAGIGDGGDTFDALDGRQLLLDYGDDQSIDGTALLLFDADEGGQSGTVDLCLSYNDTSNSEDDIYETNGTLIELATWFAIDDRRLVLTVAGAFDLTLISRGEQDGQNLYSMSYGGETASWLSDSGLIDLESSSIESPTDDESCEALLNTL